MAMMSVQLVVQLPPVYLDDGFASGLSLSLSRDFLTEWIVDTFRRWNTFLPFLELLVSLLRTDMLLSLPMLLLESSSESLAG